MSLEIPFGIKRNTPGDVDDYYGPYANLAVACAAVPVAVRPKKTVMVYDSTYGYIEHWWLNGTLDEQLIPKRADFIIAEYIDGYNVIARIRGSQIGGGMVFQIRNTSATPNNLGGGLVVGRGFIEEEFGEALPILTEGMAAFETQAAEPYEGDVTMPGMATLWFTEDGKLVVAFKSRTNPYPVTKKEVLWAGGQQVFEVLSGQSFQAYNESGDGVLISDNGITILGDNGYRMKDDQGNMRRVYIDGATGQLVTELV